MPAQLFRSTGAPGGRGRQAHRQAQPTLARAGRTDARTAARDSTNAVASWSAAAATTPPARTST